VINEKTKEFIEKTVRENFTPDNLNLGLKALEVQLEEATGQKRTVIEGFISGIKMSLGRI